MATRPSQRSRAGVANIPMNYLLFRILLISICCSLCYILGTHNLNLTTFPQTPQKPCLHSPPSHPLHFQPHHFLSLPPDVPLLNLHFFPRCPSNFTNHCPCHDPNRETLFDLERKYYRERHCPEKFEALRCLIPDPIGYRKPFPWPKSKDYAWFSNVPFKRLATLKKDQNWVRLQGDRFFFPGGGTSFKLGVEGYVNELKRILPLKSGAIRTVLDVGCGVASFGASLLDYNILTMSIAPRDIHESQVQLALERGVPAMLGILSTHRLPFPSRSFDMAHCSRCLVQWTAYDGLFLLEIDRVLRSGGYWVLSGPPLGWKENTRNRTRTNLDQSEQNNLEDLAGRLCWKKVSEKATLAVWQKPTNHIHCSQKLRTWKSPKFCADADPDAGWYKKMHACIMPLPEVESIHEMSGGALENWPKRLNTAPPRITRTSLGGITTRTFLEDSKLWKMRVHNYENELKFLSIGNYRNIMDMNAGLGGFAAALLEYPVWVMNVVPVDVVSNTLGVIYERGLVGTYMNWCEPFSTYPRTYDVLHADGLFALYMNKCDIHDILFEMHRILRPQGVVIIRDYVDIIVKIKDIASRMKWNAKISHGERGPFHPEKLLIVDNSGIGSNNSDIGFDNSDIV